MKQIQLVICIRKNGKVFRSYGPWYDSLKECFTEDVEKYIFDHAAYYSIYYEFKTRKIEEPKKEEDAAKQPYSHPNSSPES